MSNMQVRPVRELRNNYAEISRLLKQHDHIVITKNGVGDSVLINFEDYGAYQEYLHHRFIYKELQKSKKEADDPKIKMIAVTEVFDRIENRVQILEE